MTIHIPWKYRFLWYDGMTIKIVSVGPLWGYDDSYPDLNAMFALFCKRWIQRGWLQTIRPLPPCTGGIQRHDQSPFPDVLGGIQDHG